MAAFKAMEPRKGLKGCFDGLRKAEWDVYAVTNGGKETSLQYFRNASIELADDHLLSCDEIQAAKPDVKVYNAATSLVGGKGSGAGERWFAACHGWDLIAAREAGFKTAWLDYEEYDPITSVFGEFDIYASSMDELLEKLNKV